MENLVSVYVMEKIAESSELESVEKIPVAISFDSENSQPL